MKKALYLLLLVFALIELPAQNQYVEYYNLVNQANEFWYQKDYDKALQFYQKGFEKVDYVHAFNYAKAARSAIKLKQLELGIDFIKEAVKRGYPSGFFKQKLFKKHLDTETFLNLEKELTILKAAHDLAINRNYKTQIDSLHYIDQTILRGNKIRGEFSLDSMVSYSDSSNFACILKLIKEYGFPSEQEIGYEGYRKAWVLIHHSARLSQNHQFHPMLLDYVKQGMYQPENYAWVVDQGQELLEEKLIYYHWDVATDIDQLTNEEKIAIDEERAKIGMPPIARIEVKTKKGKKVNLLRW